MKNKLQYISFVCMLWGFCAVNVFAGGKMEKIPEGKIPVAASFDAMKELTEAVGKDKVYVKCIIPPGMGAHHFEPKAGDLKFLGQAKAVVYNGLGMEPWLENAVKAVRNDNLVQLRISDGIIPIELENNGEEVCDCGMHHGNEDPHIWLSLASAIVMIENISEGLSKIDPANAAFYAANAAAFTSEAEALLKDYRNKFAQVKNKHFITGHAAFGYLCRDFGLEQSSVSGVFAAEEPTAQQLAKLTDHCKEHGIKTIFAETMVSPAVSQTLAKEAGAAVEVIYTLESAEKNGLSYMDRMKHNLERIYASLKK